MVETLNVDFKKIPSEITHQGDALIAEPGGMVANFGKIVRDGLFLPFYQELLPKDLRIEQEVATQYANNWKSSLFESYDVTVKIPGPEEQKITEIFKLRVYDSKEPINGKNLRIVQFCFNGNEQEESGESKRWDPQTLRSLTNAPLNVMKALQDAGIPIDSMLNSSLGNVVLDGVDQIDEKYIPPTILINRGLTSIEKVTSNIEIPALKRMLMKTIAYATGWFADPEAGLLRFAEKCTDKKRTVGIFEALYDNYFGEKAITNAAFDPNYCESLRENGFDAFRINYFPAPYQKRSHHSIPLDKLIPEGILENKSDIPFEATGTAADIIAQQVFFKEDGKTSHTCFCIGGSEATVEKDLMRVTEPLINASAKVAKIGKEEIVA